MTKKLPVDNFKWETNLTIFTEDFIKSYDEESDIGYLLFVDVIYPEKIFVKNVNIDHFYLKRLNVIKLLS